MYRVRDIAVLAYVAGLLTGLIVAFSACTPNPDAARDHITTGGHP